MKYIRNFKIFESSNIVIRNCEKSLITYEFMSKYLDIIDYDAYINNDNLYQVAAYDNYEIIGLSIYRMKDGKIHMNYSAISPDYRNKGINKLLKLKIIEIGKSNNCSIITVNVRESNIQSLRSLQSSGFVINTSVDLYYPDGEKKLPLFLKLK